MEHASTISKPDHVFIKVAHKSLLKKLSMMKICIVSLFLIIFSVIILRGSGNLSDRIVLTTSREEDPETWFDKENPQFQYIGQLWIGGTRYVKAKLRNANCKETNVFKEDPAVKLLRKKPEMLWVKQEEIQRRKSKKTTTNDTEWHNLWYLNGDVSPSMKVTEAWSKGYSGKHVTIAVVDGGLQTNHTDISENIDIEHGFSFRTNTNNPYPRTINDSHGTRVTGLIAAIKDNNECIPGVAFHCTVIGIQLLDDDDDEERCEDTIDSEEAAALKHYISNVDIYSNSWGPAERVGFAGPGMLTEKVILDGVTTGRNGKGVIYVFAAGNGGIDDNCNADGYANSMYTIAITSVAKGKQAVYAEVCASALAATYGGSREHRYLTSTTLWSDCTSEGIEGTSFSAPIASGIIALTLEANPNLTWRDIQHLIVLTSKRYNFKDTYKGWSQNGVFLEYSQILGFGLMDAEAMVLYGAEWKTVPQQQMCSVDSKTYPIDYLIQRLSQTINVTTGLCSTIEFLEHVQVIVTFSSIGKRGNFEITLEHLDFGTKTKLLHPRTEDIATIKDGFTWTFMSVHFWGETSNGRWSLTITPKISVAASIHRWSIQFFGTESDPLSTATYYVIVSFAPLMDHSSESASSNYTLCIELKAKLEEYWRKKLGRGFYRLALEESTANVTVQRVFINKTKVDSMVKEIYSLVHGGELIGFGNIISVKVWNLERSNEKVLITNSTLENELCSIRTTLSSCSSNQKCEISNGKPSCVRNDYLTETNKGAEIFSTVGGFVGSALVVIFVAIALIRRNKQKRTENERHLSNDEVGNCVHYVSSSSLKLLSK